MNKGAFWASVEKSVQLLKKLDMDNSENFHKNFDYSPECRSYSRSEDYDKIYKCLLESLDYDVILYDYSLLQFDYKSDKEIRMVYIQNPKEFESFEDFLSENKIEHSPQSIYRLREEMDNDYQQVLTEKPRLICPVYMRYDLDAKNRLNNENVHAYAHLHIGLNNNIRIPIGIDLNPLTFMLFIIRHVYYDIWVNSIKNDKIDQVYLDCKNQCCILDSAVWTHDEKKALYIG